MDRWTGAKFCLRKSRLFWDSEVGPANNGQCVDAIVKGSPRWAKNGAVPAQRETAWIKYDQISFPSPTLLIPRSKVKYITNFHHSSTIISNFVESYGGVLWGQTVKSLVWFHPAHPAHRTHSAPVSQRNVIWHWEAPGSQRGMRWGIGISGRVTKQSDVKVAQVAQCSRY